jgi:hypothetical protein
MMLRIALVAAVWVVGGCSASGGSRSLEPASVQPTQMSETGSGSPGTIDLPPEVIDPVVAEIASVAEVPADQVRIVSAEAVTFGDGSLGCPVPGVAYTQALVDGYKIVAEAGGQMFDYRGTGIGKFRRCTTSG